MVGHRLTPDDLLRREEIGEVALSPDGRLLAYVLKRPRPRPLRGLWPPERTRQGAIIRGRPPGRPLHEARSVSDHR
jgi:hypothetical protein